MKPAPVDRQIDNDLGKFPLSHVARMKLARPEKEACTFPRINICGSIYLHVRAWYLVYQRQDFITAYITYETHSRVLLSDEKNTENTMVQCAAYVLLIFGESVDNTLSVCAKNGSIP